MAQVTLKEVSDPLHATLKRYWGYDQFRPKQEQIIRSLLEGRDVAVVMPTGGGKSLCYQIPPLVTGKTAIVVSPLIALMNDQVEQLQLMGIPAAQLNSSMEWAQQREVLAGARRGVYRLVYLSPERLAREDTMEWLRSVPVSLIAVDEAHCISEWGHEFRPEYRMLSRMREVLPHAPIAAFTASATRRVRHEILNLLQLREPDRFITSFYRPNLRYVARECDAKTQGGLLRSALEEHEGDNVIVYAPTIKTVAATTAEIRAMGIGCVPYHGQMDADERRTNQERWMADEVRVLVGTIAFGLGINKPGVRAVIHLSLPKSVEQYYQEAGRAGRDGAPADCILLWRKADIGLLVHFIKQIEDKAESNRSWQRLREITAFAQGDVCRPKAICRHFGEEPKWDKCGQCDLCAGEPEWLTTAPEMRRTKERRASKRVEVSTVGTGSTARSATTSPVQGKIADPALVDRLKQWRRDVAQMKKLPAYVILHDATLVELARLRPRDAEELLEVPGIGERKAELYGEELLRLLR